MQPPDIGGYVEQVTRGLFAVQRDRKVPPLVMAVACLTVGATNMKRIKANRSRWRSMVSQSWKAGARLAKAATENGDAIEDEAA